MVERGEGVCWGMEKCHDKAWRRTFVGHGGGSQVSATATTNSKKLSKEEEYTLMEIDSQGTRGWEIFVVILSLH